MSALGQWPIKSLLLRVLLSIIAGALVFMAIDIIFSTLSTQGWNRPSFLIYIESVAALLAYRVNIFGLRQRWDTINDRM